MLLYKKNDIKYLIKSKYILLLYYFIFKIKIKIKNIFI